MNDGEKSVQQRAAESMTHISEKTAKGRLIKTLMTTYLVNNDPNSAFTIGSGVDNVAMATTTPAAWIEANWSAGCNIEASLKELISTYQAELPDLSLVEPAQHAPLGAQGPKTGSGAADPATPSASGVHAGGQ